MSKTGGRGTARAARGGGLGAAAKVMSAEEFSAAVTRDLRDIPVSSRFGEDKVFVSELWRLKYARTMSLDAFKAKLVEASKVGGIRLQRLDLVEAVSGTPKHRMFLDSEIARGTATAHLIIDEAARTW